MNRQLLLATIEKKEMTAKEVAEKIGISRATYFRKLANSGDSFTVKEIKRLCDVLELGKRETHLIFFADEVAYKRHK